MDKPPKIQKAPYILDCSESYVFPVLDGLLAFVYTLIAVNGIIDVATDEVDDDSWTQVASGAILAAPLGTSAYFGAGWASRCREFQRRQAELVEVDRERDKRLAAVPPSAVDEPSNAKPARMPIGGAALSKTIDPTTGLVRLSFEYRPETSMSLQLWVTLDAGKIDSDRIGLSLSFSLDRNQEFTKVSKAEFVADAATLLPILVAWVPSDNHQGVHDTLIGSLGATIMVAEIAQSHKVTLRVGRRKDIVVSASAHQLLVEFLEEVREALPTPFGPMQMRPRNEAAPHNAPLTK